MSFLDDLFGGNAAHSGDNRRFTRLLQDHQYAEALPLVQQAADNGDCVAMCALGAMYVLGHGIEADYAQAYRWFKMGAERGHIASQTALGMLLVKGVGAPRDYHQAAYWLYSAGKAGNMSAVEVLSALAYKDSSVIGPHFSEEELIHLVRAWKKSTIASMAATNSNSVH